MTTRHCPFYGIQGYACNGYTSAVTSNAKYISLYNPIYYVDYTKTFQYPGYNGTMQIDDKTNDCNCISDDTKNKKNILKTTCPCEKCEQCEKEYQTVNDREKTIETRCCGKGDDDKNQNNKRKENYDNFFQPMHAMFR